MKVDELIEKDAYSMPSSEKQTLFLEAMKESIRFHYNNCNEFKNYLDYLKFDINSEYSLEDLPYLPIPIFKEMELITGSKEDIKTTINSSSTTSNKPSKIPLDKITMKRQQIALKNIMSSYLGKERRIFIIFDKKSTIENRGQNTSSRASAILGMLPFAKSMKFVLNDDLEFDMELFKEAIDSISSSNNDDRESGEKIKICFFGFTWIIYKTYLSIRKDLKKLEQFRILIKELSRLSNDKKVLHIGGWKKLKEIAVEKSQFNNEIGMITNVDIKEIIDFYGMTEQLGTVYPDCEEGYKHASLYSEIIIRDQNTLLPLEVGKAGLIQLITPLPNSYPGISILTEDVGELIGIDNCKCGRKGKYFIFKKRVEKAPIKGCGDTL
ncbi:acyl-protein synthetase [Candidatus Woesearchaeota archaeon]|jgi:phenylacetate-coenzyme A ligase PaaK-like adenylate-forming protein|nr:acyl-protein synthetase [Candidatus Woesearchaeota archaeon]